MVEPAPLWLDWILIAKEADIDTVIRLDTAYILLGRPRVGIPFGAFPMEPA